MPKFQEILEEIVNIFKVKPLLNVIVLLLAFLLVSYEIISQLFLPMNVNNYGDVAFMRNLLFLFFIILGIIIYTQLMKYKIDYEKYWELISKIKFESNVGSDGLCCFVTRRDKGIPLPRNKEKLLITSALTQNVDVDEKMSDLIDMSSVKIYACSTSCTNLEMKYIIDGENLRLKLYCKDYENRPQACKDYPVLSPFKTCRLGQCCSSPFEQVEEFAWASIFFYALDKKKYPELEKFSVGIAQNFFHRYFLIPVPFKCNNFEDIICEQKK